MRLACEQPILRRAVTAVLPATSSTLSAFSGVLLKASDEALELTAFNTELAIRVRIPARAQEDGACILPGKAFATLLGKLGAADVQLSTENEKGVVLQGDSRFEFYAEPPERFPQVPWLADEGREIPARDFARAVSSVIYSCAKPREHAAVQRAVLVSVLFDLQPERTTLVALDGVRMAKTETLPLSEKTGERLVPADALRAVLRGLPDDALLTVAFRENAAQFEWEDEPLGLTLYSRLLEGRFPPYRDIIPKSSSMRLTVDRGQLLAALDRLQIMAMDIDRSIDLQFADGALRLTAASETVGRAEERVAASMEGEALAIRLNCGLLQDAAEAASGDNLLLAATGRFSAMLVTGDDPAWCAVVMPLRTAEV